MIGLVGKIAKKPPEILPILLYFENGLNMKKNVCPPITHHPGEKPPYNNNYTFRKMVLTKCKKMNL